MTFKLLPIAAVAAALGGCEMFAASEPDPGIEEWAGATWPDAPANAMARTTTYRMWITDNDGAIDGTIQTEATDTTRETVSGHRRSGDEMTLYMPWSDSLLDGGISDGTWTADKMCRNDTTVVVMVSLQDRDPSYLMEILQTGGIKGTLTQANVPLAGKELWLQDGPSVDGAFDEMVTDANGKFSVLCLQPGRYKVYVSYLAVETCAARDWYVDVVAGQFKTVDVKC